MRDAVCLYRAILPTYVNQGVLTICCVREHPLFKRKTKALPLEVSVCLSHAAERHALQLLNGLFPNRLLPLRTSFSTAHNLKQRRANVPHYLCAATKDSCAQLRCVTLRYEHRMRHPGPAATDSGPPVHFDRAPPGRPRTPRRTLRVASAASVFLESGP